MGAETVLITGCSDLGTACALRLFRAGFRIILIEYDRPPDIYHTRTFGAAAYSGCKTIEKVTARTIANAVEIGSIEPEASLHHFISFQSANREISLLSQSDSSILSEINIDYTLIANSELYKSIKENLPESKLIGFSSSQSLQACGGGYIISDEAPYFGRVIYPFLDDEFIKPDTKSRRKETLLQVKAPIEGVFTASKTVSDRVNKKEEIGKIGDIPILAPVDGQISGMLNSGIIITATTVFAEIDFSGGVKDVNIIPKENFCLAGAVLEAVLYDKQLNEIRM